MRPDDDVDEITVPLALLLNPELLDNLRAWMKDNRDGKSKGDHVVELGRLSRGEYKEFYQKLKGMTGLKT